MLALRVLNRYIQNRNNYPIIYKGVITQYSSNSSSSDSEDEKKVKQKKNKPKNTESINKLNLLLNKMLKDDVQSKSSSKSKLDLAKPKPRIRNEKSEPGTISAKKQPVAQQVISAAKNVAESLGGNVKQTESELLSKLLNSTISKDKSLNDIISGMKVDHKKKSTETETGDVASRAHQVRQMLDKQPKRRGFLNDLERKTFRKPRHVPIGERQVVNLFGTEPLGIFTKKTETDKVAKKEEPVLKTWNALQERELRLAVTHPPENYFQEMILWTEQGKVWKFPIDNEQGLEQEQNVYFAEHVFLEKYLENWCPDKGPIRHFMELVCVGLSKNSYLTAQAKKDHIMWFKDYFNSKEKILQEVGAIPTSAATNIKPKQLASE